MTIGFVLDDTLDSTDGVQQYVINLGSWLSGQGHEVHYLVGQTKRTDIANIHSLSKNIRVSFNKNRMTIPLPVGRKKIKSLLADLSLDVVHVQMPYSPMFAGRVIDCLSTTTALIGTFHILPFSKAEQFATSLLGKVLQKNLRRFDSIMAVSTPAQEFARASFGVDSIVVPNVVDSSSKPYKTTIPSTNKTEIVFVGRLVARKGILQLIDAFNRATDDTNKKRNLHLTICGRGPLMDALTLKISKYELEDVVTVTGHVTEDQKQEILSRADLAIFPSLGGESFGIVLIEAMAAGAGVVLGGNNLGYTSVLENPKTLFDPKNITEFANLILKFCDDNALRTETGSKQRGMVNKYSVDVVGRQIEKVYKTAIAKLTGSTDNT